MDLANLHVLSGKRRHGCVPLLCVISFGFHFFFLSHPFAAAGQGLKEAPVQ